MNGMFACLERIVASSRWLTSPRRHSQLIPHIANRRDLQPVQCQQTYLCIVNSSCCRPGCLSYSSLCVAVFQLMTNECTQSTVHSRPFFDFAGCRKPLRRYQACRMMLVGLGGNNGTTITGGILANKQCVPSSAAHRVILLF